MLRTPEVPSAKTHSLILGLVILLKEFQVVSSVPVWVLGAPGGMACVSAYLRDDPALCGSPCTHNVSVPSHHPHPVTGLGRLGTRANQHLPPLTRWVWPRPVGGQGRSCLTRVTNYPKGLS